MLVSGFAAGRSSSQVKMNPAMMKMKMKMKMKMGFPKIEDPKIVP